MNEKVEFVIGWLVAITIIIVILTMIVPVAIVDALTFRKFNLLTKHKKWLMPKLYKWANIEKGGEYASKE